MPVRTSVRRGLATAACTLSIGACLGAVTTGPLAGPASAVEATTASATSTAASAETPAEISARIDSLLGDATTQADAPESAATEWRDVSQAAIDPSQYECTNSDLMNWVATQYGPSDLMSVMFQYSLLDLPMYQSILFENDDTPQPIGPDGEYTGLIGREMKDLKSFWDINGNNIQLIAMNTDIYKNVDLLVPLVEKMYGVDRATAEAVAPEFIKLVNMMPGGADNPLFSFNAFAFAEQPAGSFYGGASDRIIVGDGLIEGLEAVGLDQTALLSAVGHEYGHHIQFDEGLQDNTTLTGPEATRRTELMADAFGAYYMVHAKGQAINDQKVITVAREAANVGDCNFTSDGHHGTPNQRTRTVTWAADLANAARPQGPVMPSREFADDFDAELPTLVAPDAS